MERTGAAIATAHRSSFDPNGPTGRLAELVAHLAGCPAHLAVGAVERALPAEADDPQELSADERLDLVARAIVALKHDVDLREQRHRRPA